MRRTVKDALAPPPRLRITTPSKAWSRSFSPSTTLTCTRTVSPGANPPRSFFSCPASTIRIASMASRAPSLDVVRGPAALAESVHPLLLFGREVRRLEDVRPALPRPPHGHHPAPALDLGVVAAEQQRRHLPAAEPLGPRVLGVLEESPRERVVLRRRRVAEDARQEARHRVGHHEGGGLAARQHVVADRELLVHQVLAHPLVHPLVAAADEHQMRVPRQ